MCEIGIRGGQSGAVAGAARIVFKSSSLASPVLPPPGVTDVGADASAEDRAVADAIVSGAVSPFGLAAAAGPVVAYVRECAAAVVSRAVAAVAPRASASVRAPDVVAGPWHRHQLRDPQASDVAVASSDERFLCQISGAPNAEAIGWSALALVVVHIVP